MATAAVPETVQARNEPRATHQSIFLVPIAVTLDTAFLAIGFAVAIGARYALAGVAGNYLWASGATTQYLVCAGIFVGVLAYEGAYETGIVAASQTEQLAKALTGGLIASIFFSFATHGAMAISRPVLVFWYLANLLLFLLVRPVVRTRSPGATTALVLAGSDETAAAAAARLRKRGMAAELMPQSPNPGALPRNSLCLVCTGEALPPAESILQLEATHGIVGIVPVGPYSYLFDAAPANILGLQVYVLQNPLGRRLSRTIKRTFDLIASAALLTLLAPVLLIAAIGIVIDSPGGALYSQTRLGRNGRPFRLLKLRTMQADADDRLKALLATDPCLSAEFRTNFKLKRDPRVTRIGRLLRRTSLDELPQLWNVLKGEMSLVGPRPIVEAERPLYGNSYDLIAKVRPGLTGIWQTSGRNDIAYESRPNLDLYYVRNWSFWLDVSIIVRTVQALILPDGY